MVDPKTRASENGISQMILFPNRLYDKSWKYIFLIMSWIILVPFKGEVYKIKFLFGMYEFQEIHRYVLEAAPFVNRFFMHTVHN